MVGPWIRLIAPGTMWKACGVATTRGQPSGGVGDVSAVECLRVVGKHKARMTV